MHGIVSDEAAKAAGGLRREQIQVTRYYRGDACHDGSFGKITTSGSRIVRHGLTMTRRLLFADKVIARVQDLTRR